MLSSRSGSGKYLSGEWARLREEAAQDSSSFTADQLAYLEVGPAYAVKGNGDRIDENMHVDTEPVDPNTTIESKKIDIRDRPEAGGRGL